MQANLDTTTRTLTITYEDDIDLLMLWAHLNTSRTDMLKSAEAANPDYATTNALCAKSMRFFGGAFPVWNEIDEALIKAGIIVRA